MQESDGGMSRIIGIIGLILVGLVVITFFILVALSLGSLNNSGNSGDAPARLILENPEPNEIHITNPGDTAGTDVEITVTANNTTTTIHPDGTTTGDLPVTVSGAVTTDEWTGGATTQVTLQDDHEGSVTVIVVDATTRDTLASADFDNS